MGKNFYFLLTLIIFLIIIAVQNTFSISLKFFKWGISDVPVGIILIACLLAGYFAAYIPLSLKLWLVKRRLKSLRTELPDPLPGEEENDENILDEDIPIEGDSSSSFFKE